MAALRKAHGGVLVLGGGFAGAYVARLLGRRGATIVSPENFMLFTPMLPEAASGTLEPRHVVVPLRMMCPHAQLILGEGVGLDESSRTLEVVTETGPFAIEYDHLVVALGAVTRTLPIPGLAEHGRGFKTLADAIALRNHVLRQLELADAETDPARAARHLTFVFVGAGYAGVEALAELSDLVNDALRYYPGLRSLRPRWVLVDAAPKILPEIPRKLGEYAQRQLRKRGVDVRVSTRLESVGACEVLLSDGTRFETETVVWTAGVKPHPLLSQFGLPLDERGRVRVDPALRVEGRANLWALGDNARVPNAATPDRPDPPTSQHALRQARRLASNLAKTQDRLAGAAPQTPAPAADFQALGLAPYRYAMLGQVATLGRYKGIADILGLPLSGFLGWFFTRTYHLYQLPLLSRRMRVVTDWTTSLFFRRDIAELSMLGHPRPLGEPAGGQGCPPSQGA
jgi:NADH:ubiquinone reductase (H+-translocating)